MHFGILDANGVMTGYYAAGAKQNINDVDLLQPPVDPEPSRKGPRWTYSAITKLATPLANRSPRSLIDILANMTALSTGQKNNINANVFTNRPYPFENDTGPNAGAIVAIIANSGSVAALTTAQKIGIAALYAQDVPDFFVHPAWDNTINVPGDQ